MKKILLILLFIPLTGIGQQILSKTTITDGNIVEYFEYYENGGYTVTTYHNREEWIDTIVIGYNKNGDTIYTGDNYGGCNLEKIYNDNNQLLLRYSSCSDGIPGDREMWSENIVEYIYDINGVIEKRECLGEGDSYYTHCYDNMKVTYYHYNHQNDLLEKIISVRENRDHFFRDTVFNKIETIELRIRYDYDIYGNNIKITKFNATADIVSLEIMRYENNLLRKKELMGQDTIVIDYQYDKNGSLIRVQETMEAFGNSYSFTKEYNAMSQLISISEYGLGPDYECHYQYNNDGNLIDEKCYEIAGSLLDSCIHSVYLYNSYGDLIKRTDYYIDGYELDEIGEDSYDIIDKMKFLDDLFTRKLTKAKSITNVKYEYY